MADFCGLTRVKTWRWSRLFACAVAVLCAISPMTSFGTTKGYVCQYAYATCNPGFLLTAQNNVASADSVYEIGHNECKVCPKDYYKVKRDTKSGWDSGVYGDCIGKPTNAIDYNGNGLTINSNIFGRPIALCGQNYYRAWTNNDHTAFECVSCGTGYDKPAEKWSDESLRALVSNGKLKVTSGGVVDVPDSLLGESQCWGHCADNYYIGRDTKCYLCNSNTMSNCTKNIAAENITCKKGYYKHYNVNTVECTKCPDCYTTGNPDNTSDTTMAAACTVCDSDNASCFELPELGDGNHYCAKCPSDGPNVKQCGGADNKQLLCNSPYFRLVRQVDDHYEAYCQMCSDNRNKSDDKDTDTWTWANSGGTPDGGIGEAAKCTTCIANYYRVNEWYSKLNLQDAYCHECPQGAKCTEGTDSDEGTIDCPNNTYLLKSCDDSSCDSDVGDANGAKHADSKRKYSCAACPAFTGRLQSDYEYNTRVGGRRHHCPICVEGFFGDIDWLQNASVCTPCPKFARLDSMGICIRGRTEKPNSSSTFYNFGKNGQNTIAQCYINNPNAKVVYSKDLALAPYAEEYSTYSQNVNPRFTDTMGQFEFVPGVAKACDITDGSISMTGYTEEERLSGICTPPAGQTCVYLDLERGRQNVNNGIACMRAIMWQSKEETPNGSVEYTVSDGIAVNILRHWGHENPWFCSDDPDKAAAFKKCLIGDSDADLECFWQGASCIKNSDSAKVVTCVTNGSGYCSGS